jgi:DNA repair protein RecN (Recombination protein N)
VEGRFVVDDEEVILGRVVPHVGRSRAYVDGRLAPASALGERGTRLVDLHGQHAHQSLLATATQREALDRFGSVDVSPLLAAKRRLAELDDGLAELGGDERARARVIDLLRFQVAELDAARLDDPDEDAALAAEEDALADALAHQEAAAATADFIGGEGGALDAIGSAVAAIAGRAPYADAEARLRGVAAEVADIAAEIRSTGERIEDDPERLAAVRERRQLLHDLRRKYGETLTDVVTFGDEARARLAELLDHDRRAAALDVERSAALRELDDAGRAVHAARVAAAPALAASVEARLADLAMPKATVAVAVGDEPPGDDVAFLFAAHPGAPLAPLARVASGGELARAMLALRLVLLGTAEDDSGPRTLVFDEVDAGIGGAAALSVGRALAALADERTQVLVVTHLPQVAACADTQVVVAKRDDGEVTTARVVIVDGDDRVVELSRMLAGMPESTATREAAIDLLATARGRDV